jgi:hypothetical protein
MIIQDIIVPAIVACAEADHEKGGAHRVQKMVNRAEKNVSKTKRCDARMMHPVYGDVFK